MFLRYPNDITSCFLSSVDEIVLNVDLAPTFLDIGGVAPPPHMDGRSILPLVLNRHRAILDKWPDTFLIESSGRRETPEQIQEQKQRAAAARYSARFNLLHGNGTAKKQEPEVLVDSRPSGVAAATTGFDHGDLTGERKELDFSSHEHDDDEEDHDEDDGKLRSACGEFLLHRKVFRFSRGRSSCSN